MYKCKLCGSEVAINQYPHTQVQISGDRCCCPNGDCNLHLVSLTKSEWQKLNATWIAVAERLPEEQDQLSNNQKQVWIKYDSCGKICYGKAVYYKGGVWSNNDGRNLNIISWMEIEE